MKRLFIILAMMLACLSSIAQIEITEAQALQLVKNQYQTNTINDFYITETDTIFDDGDFSCVLEDIPQEEWLVSNSPKWLIFVDEQPMANWSHPCSYFYIPKRDFPTNGGNIHFAKFKGAKYPRKIKLTLLESQREVAEKHSTPQLELLHNYGNPSHQRTDEEEFDYPIVIMIGGGYEKENNYLTYWNDCEYLYNILRQDYGMDTLCFLSFFPTFQLRTFEGYESYVDRPIYYNNVQPWYYPLMYPNRKDMILEKLNDFYLMEENLPYKNSNLIFYITSHGDLDRNSHEPYICLLDATGYIDHATYRDNRLYATELDSIASVFGARNTTFILQNCFSGAFVDYLQGPGRTIITACSENECSSSMDPVTGIEHNEFSYHFTNAIHQADKFGTPVNSDTDYDGQITMKEAFLYAQNHDSAEETPMYNSMPEWLGDEFSFDILPDSSNLYVRDNLQDIGSNIHPSTGTYWNSPDIWVRNSDDGFGNQENDHLLVGNDQKLYVYVRVNNRGYRDYVDPSKYLHLYWKENTLNMSKNAVYGTGSLYGGKITALSLDTAIASDTSCIYRYTWQLPATLVSRFSNNGNILDIEVLALVNDTIVSVIPEDAGGMIALRENSNVAMRKENTIKPSLGKLINIPPFDYLRRVKIPVYISPSESNTASKITLEIDTASVGNLFTYCSFYLELSPGIYASSSNLPRYNITTTNSAPRKYKLNGNGSYFSLIVPQVGIDSLVLYCDYTQLQPSNDINSILHLKLTNVNDSLLDVETYRVFIAGNSGGGPGGPGIITMTGNDGSSQLVATGIEDPSQLEWYSPHQELIGENETLQLAANRQQGTYTLRVASKLTGAVSFATTTIVDENAIENVTPNPFSSEFTVHLTCPVNTTRVIRISPIGGNGRVAEYPVAAGEHEVIISAKNCPSGIYIVNLIEDGMITGSYRIIKN